MLEPVESLECLEPLEPLEMLRKTDHRTMRPRSGGKGGGVVSQNESIAKPSRLGRLAATARDEEGMARVVGVHGVLLAA